MGTSNSVTDGGVGASSETYWRGDPMRPTSASSASLPSQVSYGYYGQQYLPYTPSGTYVPTPPASMLDQPYPVESYSRGRSTLADQPLRSVPLQSSGAVQSVGGSLPEQFMSRGQDAYRGASFVSPSPESMLDRSFHAPSFHAGMRTRPLISDALMIWDWDDTLMCSSAINANQFPPHQYSQLENIVEQVLVKSMTLGETHIVTNADELWVLESTRRFLPRVLPLLSQMPVMSARRKYEASCPGDVFAWKREAFREVIGARQASSVAGGTNLIVLGDSLAEMEAARTSTVGLVAPAAVKTVKFKETPSVDELLEQLKIVNQELATIVADERTGCRNLAQWIRPSIAGLQLNGTAAYLQPGVANYAAQLGAHQALPATAYGFVGPQATYTRT
mmetsp:Transcript_96643/g.171875  ORF Transcript_96643/g.171875 Transcript_96643/m.171875 type:complete len:391 (+) Transcript_96643:33-1205(+)